MTRDSVNRAKGFTLVEVVISIATLSLISVFILQMFIVSAQLNRDAADIDKAVALSASVMDALCAQKLMSDAPEGVQLAGARAERTGERELCFTLNYDKDWAAIQDESAAAYTLVARVTEPPDEETAKQIDSIVSPLTYLSVKVQRNAASGASVTELADLSGAHYFGGGR